MTVFGTGASFDELADRLHDMGQPAARFGRVRGKHTIWVKVTLPGLRQVERVADTLDQAALAVLALELTADDQARANAIDSLEQP